MKSPIIFCLLLICVFSNVQSQESFNESKEFGIQTGLFYFDNAGYLEPGIHFRIGQNQFQISNEIHIPSSGILNPSHLKFHYRRYPFKNLKETKIYFYGEFDYYHTERNSQGTQRAEGYFLLLGAGLQYDLIQSLRVGLYYGLGRGFVIEGPFANEGLVFHGSFAFSISYSFKTK